jgi:peroxiredoxin Q/BCP
MPPQPFTTYVSTSASGRGTPLEGAVIGRRLQPADCDGFIWRRASSRPPTTIPPMIEPKDKAPDFELPDQDGNPVKLSDLRGQQVVVYFYPKADTPGCTTQACGVRDHRADYAKAGAVVLGISPDTVAKVKKFHDKQGLNFTLLADDGHAVADAYGVWVQKSMYGKTYFGNERTTFVIDRDGRISDVLRKVKPSEHDELVLRALE